MSSTPVSGATSVDVGTELIVRFNRPIDARTVAAAVSLTRSDGTRLPATTRLELGGLRLTVTPTGNLRFWQGHQLVLDGLRALGNVTCTRFSMTFSTRAPVAAPRPARPAAADDVVLLGGDTALTASASYRGVQVWNVGNPAAPALVGEVRTGTAGPLRLVVEGDRVYAPTGASGVLVLGVANPRAPVLLGTVQVPLWAGDATAFARGGTRWLAVAEARGVGIYDVTNPAQVVERAVLDTAPGGEPDTRALAVDEARHLLWVAAGRDGLMAYDVTNPAAPVLLSTSVFYDRPITGVFPSGRWVWAARGAYGVLAFDALDPAAPQVVSSAVGPNGECSFSCLDFFVRFARDGALLHAPVGLLGVASFSIDDATGALTPVATLATGGSSRGVAAAGGLVYTASMDGLGVWQGGAALAAPAASGGGLASGLAVDPTGVRLHVASQSRGLETYSLASGVPVLLGRDATPASAARSDQAALGVAVTASQVLVADGRLALARFSAGDDPVLGGQTGPFDTTQVVVVDDARGVAYACAGNAGVASFDVSGTTPTLLSLLRFGWFDLCGDLVLADGRLYVGGVRLAVADVSNPSGMRWLGNTTLPANGRFVGLARVGSHLVASTSTPDESMPGFRRRGAAVFVAAANPTLVAQTSGDLGGAGRVLVIGDKAFIAGGNGVIVLDLRVPTAPHHEGTVATQGQVVDLARRSGTLYTAERAAGVGAIDLGLIR